METRLVYYVAQTVDGFIADRTGGVGFLDGLDESGGDYGYGEFYAGIDSLVMGRATYDFVRSMGVWHYAGKPTVVMTSRPGDDAPEDVRFAEGRFVVEGSDRAIDLMTLSRRVREIRNAKPIRHDKIPVIAEQRICVDHDRRNRTHHRDHQCQVVQHRTKRQRPHHHRKSRQNQFRQHPGRRDKDTLEPTGNTP